MPSLEAALSPSPMPRRRVRLALDAGAAGEARLRRISGRLATWSPAAFELVPHPTHASNGSGILKPLTEALLAGKADFAACDAELLPLELPAGIRLEGAMRTGDPHYCLLAAPGCASLDSLVEGATVAVVDAAARAQLLYLYPTLGVELVSPQSRIVTGMSHARWDAAIVCAESPDVANLVLHPLASARFVAPSGRGVTALLAADASDPSEPWRRLLNEPDTEDCLICERAYLARMTGWEPGLPIARASRIGGRLELDGLIAHPDGKWLVSARASGPPSFGRILGLEVAESCREIAASRHGPPSTPRATTPGRSRA
jgi:porphobilinogen deaminase